jgi:hypothetical protein
MIVTAQLFPFGDVQFGPVARDGEAQPLTKVREAQEVIHGPLR